MENLVAILIGLIWLAYKYYQKSRKKDAVQTSGQTESDDAFSSTPVSQPAKEPEQEFEAYIEQFFGIPSSKNEPEPVTASAPDWTREGAAPEIEVSYDSIEYQKDIKEKPTHKEPQVSIVEDEEDESSLLDDFDLEKAVVYSEIMKPRYF